MPVIFGTEFSETLDAQPYGLSDDDLYGFDGNDLLLGWDGDDYLDGGWGDDILSGEYDNDLLYGGPGFDTLTGGPGADIFYVESTLEITDYAPWEGDVYYFGTPLDWV
jgi:Ca2+-binding RTX toxin-like protein